MAPTMEMTSSRGGPVVTGLVADPRRAEVVRVLVDGRPYCAVPATAAAAAGLRAGVALDSDLLDRLGIRWRTRRGIPRRPAGARAALVRRAELGRRLVLEGHRPEAVEHARAAAAWG
jgi:hypothetical protein